ncbi:MAG: GAP family protein [Actinomycetota bacterium]
MTNLLAILPMAIVMVAGPQIVSAILLATSQEARRSSLAYVLGVALAVVIGLTIIYTLATVLDVEASSGGESDKNWVDYAITALLLFLMVRVYLRRHDTEPPKWMGKLATATPGFAFKLGFLLFLVMPTDVITVATVATFLVRQDAPLFYALPFVFLTVLLVAIPLLVLLLLGPRADVILPKLRAWMNANSWIVSEFVILLFLVLSL